MSLMDDYLRPATAPSPAAASQTVGINIDPMDLVGNVGSGLSYAAGVIEKPSRAVRGALYGRPREMLNLVPFSDTIGLTNPSDRVSGNEMMGIQADGLLDEIPGLALEIALDPLTYVGGIGLMGRLAKGGKAVAATGKMDDVLTAATKKLGRTVGPREAPMVTSLADLPGRTQVQARRILGPDDFYRLRDKPLGGMFSTELPGVGQLGTFGKGRLSQRAAQGLDIAGKWAKGTAPVRGTRMLFDTRVMDKIGKRDQEIAEALHPKMKEARAVGALKASRIAHEMEEPYMLFRDHFGSQISGLSKYEKSQLATRANYKNEDLTRTAFNKVIRLSAELDDQMRAFGEILPGMAPTREILSKMKSATDAMVNAKNAAYQEALDLGMSGAMLDNFMIEHFPRYLDRSLASRLGLHDKKILQTQGMSTMARDERIRHLPAEIVNRIGRDPIARGPGAAGRIMQKYSKYLDPKDPAGTAAGLADFAETHKNLKKYAQDLFTNAPAEDFARNFKSVQANLAAVKAVHQVVRDNLSDSGIAVAEVYKRAGMDPAKAMAYLGPLARRKFVPTEVADAITATLRPAVDAEWMDVLGGKLDEWIGMWKGQLTVPFPAFHTRNLTSGQYMNMVSGQIRNIKDVAKYGSEFKEALRWWRTGRIPRHWEDEMLAYGVLDPHNLSDTGIGGTTTRLSSQTFPLGSPLAFRNIAKAAGKKVDDAPWAIDNIPTRLGKGVVRAGRVAGSMVMEGGSRMAHGVELLNRAPMYMYLRRKGWSPGAAAKKVLELQVDYRDMTDFERKVMKRLVPFYSFTRKIAPTQLKILAERPGGAHGQSLRAMTALRGGEDDELVPDYISQQLSIPVGARRDGVQRYLTGFGLPQEDMFGLFRPGATLFKTIQGTGEELLGRTNPLVKVPFELISGRQLFSGRNLEDLRGVGGDILYNAGLADEPGSIPLLAEQALSNSPAARYLSTTRTILDPRKQADPLSLAMQLGTGVKYTDLDIERAQGQIIRDVVRDKLRPSPHFSHFEKIFPARGAELDPIEAALWDLHESTLRRRN